MNAQELRRLLDLAAQFCLDPLERFTALVAAAEREGRSKRLELHPKRE